MAAATGARGRTLEGYPYWGEIGRGNRPEPGVRPAYRLDPGSLAGDRRLEDRQGFGFKVALRPEVPGAG